MVLKFLSVADIGFSSNGLPVFLDRASFLIGWMAIAGVTAMTDVTGFGLMGHLIEMAEGAGLSAELNYAAIPVIVGAREYMAERIVPDATYRNWNSYSNRR